MYKTMTIPKQMPLPTHQLNVQ